MDLSDLPTISIADAIRAAADAAAPAIVGPHGEILTYRELLNQVESLGRFLLASDITPSDRVALIATGGAEMVVGFLGIAAVAGCAPLNPSYTAAEFEFFLRDLQPRLLLREAGVATEVDAVARRLSIPVQEFRPGSVFTGGFRLGGVVSNPASACRFVTVENAALILHTSGTTSRPKMVPLTQRNLCQSAYTIAWSLRLSPSDCCLNIMPLFHIHGLVGAVLTTLVSGGCVKCASGFAATPFAYWLGGLQPTWYTAVPTMHQTVLSQVTYREGPLPMHALRFIRSCSAPLPGRVRAELEECFGVPVLEAYGMTEAAHQITCNPLPPGERKPGSVGVATGTEIAIVNDNRHFLGRGEIGEIVISGPNVTSGYLGDPAVTTDSFMGSWFRTGDLGWIDDAGYLFLSGRIKEIINRGGEKIAPFEIEEAILDHPDVAEVVAFGVPDDRLGEDVGVAIVLRPGVAPLDSRALREFLALRVAAFKLPRHIAFVGEIPRGPTGKLQRTGLAKALLENAPEAPSLEPLPVGSSQPDDEAGLAAIWCKALRSRTVDVDDDFFSLGGDSLTALKMLTDVEKRYGVALTVPDLLNAPTISLLSRTIAQAKSRGQPPRVAVIQRGKSQPLFFGIGAGPRFRELARLLGPDQAFVAPTYPPPADLPRHCRIEDIARYHVRSIRHVQRSGPYFLGGWCVDGLVAYEVAQQLKAAGELVALLVLFDTSFTLDGQDMSWVASSGAKFQALMCSLSFHFSMTIQQPSWAAFWVYVSRHANRIGERLRHQYLYARFRLRGGRAADGWRQVSAVQHKIAARYRPEPYDGAVLLLHRSARYWLSARARRVWGNLLRGPLEIHEIEGDHGDMFDQPQVVIAAEKLRARLRMDGQPTDNSLGRA